MLLETMADQLVAPVVSFRAQRLLALVYPILCVSPLMLVLVATRRKCLRAKVATVGPFTGVHPLVHHKIRLVSKYSTTYLILET